MKLCTGKSLDETKTLPYENHLPDSRPIHCLGVVSYHGHQLIGSDHNV